MAEFSLKQGDLDSWIQVISLSVTEYDNFLFEDHQSDVMKVIQVFGFNNVRSRCVLLSLYSNFIDPSRDLVLIKCCACHMTHIYTMWLILYEVCHLMSSGLRMRPV